MIAFVSYETEFAPSGGIAAVLARLPGRVAACAKTPTVVFTPFHHRIGKTANLPLTWAGSFGVPFDGRNFVVHVHRHDGPAPHYFIRPEDPSFFAGAKHPYDVDAETLFRDALFFGAAVLQALRVIAPGAPWTLLLQDWEAATVALAAAGKTSRPRMFLTLHNSYDFAAEGGRLKHAGFAPHTCPGETVLQRALGVCEWPVFTVSDQFARDLVEDPFQSKVLAPHLAHILSARIVGVDNGPFTDLAVPQDLLAQAERRTVKPLLDWKATHLTTFLTALDKFVPAADRPVWGDLTQFGRDRSPLFVMAGRDDCRQKGYDVATRAAEDLLESGVDARFVFFPIPGDEGLAGLSFLKGFAARHPRHVLGFPFRFAEGFVGALRGATCGVMPSLYEPFGMANEFYLNGTIGIGRATGGVLQQIVPAREAASTSAAVRRLIARVHAKTAPPTGFLFHEPDGLPTEIEDWKGINATAYRHHDSALNRVEERMRFPLFQAMVTELRQALADVVDVSQRPADYARLLTTGIRHIQSGYSWDRAAQGYLRYAGG